MSVPFGFLGAVCRAAAPALSGGTSVAGEVGVRILAAVWDWWGAKSHEADRRRDLEAVARMTAEEYREVVREAVAAHAAGESARLQAQLQAYLVALQAQIRRASRRPSDPAGLTISSKTVLARAEDLLPMLPPRPPRFAPDDSVPGFDLQLVALLGIGGFGEVWKARNPFSPKKPPVALKFCLDSDAARSLKKEAELLDRIQHEGKHAGIVDLIDTRLSADPPFLIYEWVDGGDLGGFVIDRARKSGVVSADDAARIVRRLAEITGFAHAKGIVHRDLKPANVLTYTGRRADGTPEIRFKVTDFGIGGITAAAAARATGRTSGLTSAAALGSYTANYASPEQERGALPDPRDDVHALGVIWYQMLIGDLTVPAPRGPGWKRRLKEQGVPTQHIDLIEACVSSERIDRPATGEALVTQLRTGAAEPIVGEPIDPMPSGPRVRPVPPPLPPLPPPPAPPKKPRRPAGVPALGTPDAWPRYEALLTALRRLRLDRNRVVWSRSWVAWFISTLCVLPFFAMFSSLIGVIAQPRTIYPADYSSYSGYSSYSPGYDSGYKSGYGSGYGYSSYSTPKSYTSYARTGDTAAVLAMLAIGFLVLDRVRAIVRRRRNPDADPPPPSTGALTYLAVVFGLFSVICMAGSTVEWSQAEFVYPVMTFGIGGLFVSFAVLRRIAAGRIRTRVIAAPGAIQAEYGEELAAIASGIDLRNTAQLDAAIRAIEESYLVPAESGFRRFIHRLSAPL